MSLACFCVNSALLVKCKTVEKISVHTHLGEIHLSHADTLAEGTICTHQSLPQNLGTQQNFAFQCSLWPQLSLLVKTRWYNVRIIHLVYLSRKKYYRKRMHILVIKCVIIVFRNKKDPWKEYRLKKSDICWCFNTL